jgi:hypothetical protein
MDEIAALLEPHIPALRRYAWALLRDADAADDLVQDIRPILLFGSQHSLAAGSDPAASDGSGRSLPPQRRASAVGLDLNQGDVRLGIEGGQH